MNKHEAPKTVIDTVEAGRWDKVREDNRKMVRQRNRATVMLWWRLELVWVMIRLTESRRWGNYLVWEPVESYRWILKSKVMKNSWSIVAAIESKLFKSPIKTEENWEIQPYERRWWWIVVNLKTMLGVNWRVMESIEKTWKYEKLKKE